MGMRHVTFARAQAPHGVGDKRLVTDEVARQLLKEEVIADLGEPFPANERRSPAPKKPARPIVRPERPAGVPDQRLALDL